MSWLGSLVGWLRTAQAATRPPAPAETMQPTAVEPVQPSALAGAAVNAPAAAAPNPYPDRAARNVRAFLDALTLGEGTSGANGYRQLCGGGTFAGFDEHPAERGWKGWPMPAAMCRAAGVPVGSVSTAAGRYQINRPTWRPLRKRLGLTDFSPASQDAAAVELIREKGALDDVRAGRFDAAVAKVRRVWASLPGSGWGQREESRARVRAAFVKAGGALA